jgi:hypothetical protein
MSRTYRLPLIRDSHGLTRPSLSCVRGVRLAIIKIGHICEEILSLDTYT